MRILDQGVPLTAMPSFKLLPEPEKRAVIAYIKSLSDKWKKEKPARPLVRNVEVPDFVGTPSSVEKGKAIYNIRCMICHGMTGKGDGPAGRNLRDIWGNPIHPANFTYGRIKRGDQVEDIYKSITLGVDGTPMPSWASSLSDEERWHLVSYILKLMGRIK